MSQAQTLERIISPLDLKPKEKKILKYLRDDGRYGEEFYQEFSKIERASSLMEIGKKIENSSFIYFGDYHTVPETQAEIAKGVEKIVKNFNTIIYVEFVYKKDQHLLDDYFDDKISINELFKKLNFKSKGFMIKNYMNIIKTAKDYGVRVVAINSDGELNERDEEASKIIANNYYFRRNFKHVIIFGEHHLAREHLISKVSRKTNNYNYTIILQNLNHLYQKAIPFLEKSRIMKLDEDAFCIYNLLPSEVAKKDLEYFMG